jgi:hypothetical protein
MKLSGSREYFFPENNEVRGFAAVKTVGSVEISFGSCSQVHSM